MSAWASPPETVDALLAYAVLNKPPADQVAFRRLVGQGGRLGGLSAACFLLYCPPGQTSVRRFVLHTAPLLLSQLNRTTQARRVRLHGRTRGRVDWSATYKRRFSEDSNPTVFVCLQSWRRFDRPENRLFVYLLKAVQDCLRRVPGWLWDWQAWGRDLGEAGGEELSAEAEQAASLEDLQEGPLVIGDYFALLAHRLRLLRGHIALQEIPIPESISSQQITAACTSKNELYGELAAFYDLYQGVVGYPVYERWRRVLTETLPLPESAAEIGVYLRR